MDLNQIANWIRQSPSLLDGTDVIAPEFPDTLYDGDNLNKEYQGNHRLGFIYQHVCSQLFASSAQYQLLAEEIQLNNEHKQTLGAIDFIVDNQATRHIEQWEVAVKFYLLHNSLWYGPNSQDRLDKKLERMLNHQLTMCQTSLFQETYPDWNPVVPKLLMQGRLYINPFRPELIPEQCLDIPINLERVKGFWCFKSEVDKIADSLYPLQKWQWITGASDYHEPLGNIGDRFVHAQTKDGTFWFVVPDEWPKKTKK
ncbi:DUF1853 family protein [Vibrio viridaestus]|uniref:DUF1853 family protein n=1 Tax=Vibrio viridaestus TaxID=2487322 RepID=A0A3N9TJ20_9VIBR|nr:DUF1853 family protein [Vibrio viridaestus]RQW64130.1 DUF1853 family protein [Vibrio viridaestus]